MFGAGTDREALIARKQTVLAEAQRIQRTLESLRSRQATGQPVDRREIERLESRAEQLMAEEFNLRMAIDRAR